MPFYNSDYLLRILVLLCGAQVTTSCLSCFTTPEERARICEYPVSLNKISADDCLQSIHHAFSRLDDILIAFSEIRNIRSYIQTFEAEVRAISEDDIPSAWVNRFVNTTKHFVLKLKELITTIICTQTLFTNTLAVSLWVKGSLQSYESYELTPLPCFPSFSLKHIFESERSKEAQLFKFRILLKQHFKAASKGARTRQIKYHFRHERKASNVSLYIPIPYTASFSMKHHVESKPPSKCKPPCGLQKAARTFICSRCAQEDCTFPVACPLEVLRVEELGKSIIPCGGLFELPEFLKVIWKYARNLKTTDLGYFVDIFSGEDLFILIEPSRVIHIGTYVCEVTDEDDDIILRRFTYLDVIKNANNPDNNLEEDFQRALESKTPEEVEEEKKKETGSSKGNPDSPIRYVIYAAICCLFITLVFGYLWHYSLNVDW
ncbi:sperm acrosome membrane-associated protein 6 [Phyllobates terribilis]|uniref:sperm acrosome membrane-associated protein 6 n=1 Tax=Phyllobates terribilis TaxID=111132 RepID=UPI003CCB6107